jgi:predicted nucleic acid-binding protein
VVIVADTNVWARAFLGDDPRQSPKARRALAAARTKEGMFIPLVVMAELAWVLRGAKWERDRVLKTLEASSKHGESPRRPRILCELPSTQRREERGADSPTT